MGLSVCMIVKNEALMLGDALGSVKGIADEIIVVDTGSTDNTVEIAKSCGATVYSFPWNNDFSAARNFSLSKATQDWVLILDGDEVLDSADHMKIRGLMNDSEVVAYAFRQVSYTNDVTLYGYQPIRNTFQRGMTGAIDCNIIRMFRNHRNIVFEGVVHESIDAACAAAGIVKKVDVMIHHYQFLKGEDVHREKQLEYLRMYEQHIDYYPNKARAYRDMGSICYTFLREYARAITYFKKSMELNPQNAKTYIGLAASYFALGKTDAAAATAAAGLYRFPDDQTLQHLLLQAQR